IAKSIFMTAQPNNKPEEEAELPALIIGGDACILPFELARIPIGNSQDCKAIAASLKLDGAKHLVATFTSHDADDSETKLAGRIGTVCAVQQLLLLPSPSLVLRGLSRCRFHAWVSGSNSTQVGRRFFWSQQPQQQQSPRRARVAMLTSDVEEVDAEATAEELRQLISLCQRLGVLRASPTSAAASEAAAAAEDASDIKDGERKRLASQLPDLLGGLLSLSTEQRLRLLAATTHRERAAVLLPILRSRLRDKTGDAAAANSSSPTSSPRAGGGPIGELASRLAAADLPKAASEAANRELARLRSITSGAQHHHPEAGVIQTYLETLLALPWRRLTPPDAGPATMADARRLLDAEHHGLASVKERVLQFLAVRRLRPSLRPPLLCLVAPPGCGKTSVAGSLARCLGRPLQRIALGGVADAAELRGHRRTYVGAMPGRLLAAVRAAGVRDPVLLLDELDKLGRRGMHGDPSATLLEALDAEQNSAFVDHYLGVPFDLSQVLFVATANTIDSIPPALLDRFELVHFDPLSRSDKVRIATDHLLPKQLSQHGLEPGSVLLREAELLRVIDAYTREAGVRQLERRLARLCRHAALLAAEAPPSEPLRVDADVLRQIFEEADGADCRPTPSPYEQMTMSAANSGAPLEPGVCPVLAVTPHGGEVLLLECGWTLEPAVDGGGQTTDLAPVCTGQVGEVMRESVTLCISWLSSRLNSQLRRNRCRLHVHFPSGAVPKDGTSAGLPLAAALTSLASGTPVRAGVALTGEVTLRGRVLAIGGVPAKLEAAARAGLHSVVLPMANRIEATRTAGRLGLAGRLRLHCVETVDQALRFALEPAAGHRGLGDWPALPIKDEDSTEDREALSARPKL
ncbi:hypothetical protein BOX15_Mlig025870g2, partial [Macrostomum lignano]